MRFNPPFTGNTELDSFLADLARYVSDLNTGVTADEGTGQVGDPIGGTLQYLRRYLHVKFAQDTVGTGFGDSETSALYFGLFNSNSSTESTRHYDYSWYPATFGLTNHLYSKNLGGRAVEFYVGSSAPDAVFQIVGASAIDLDAIISAVLDGSITTVKLADGSVTEPKLGTASVSVTKLATTGTPTSSTYLSGAMSWTDPLAPHVAASDPHTQYAQVAGDLFSGTMIFQGFSSFEFPLTTSSGYISSASAAVKVAASQGVVPYVIGMYAYGAALPSGSTITEAAGFYVDTLTVGASFNYGFISAVAAGTGAYNFYASTTAENYFAGVTTFGRTIVAPAGVTTRAPLRIPHGVEPSAGNITDGDIWTTTAGIYVRINGATVGPLGTGGGGGGGGTDIGIVLALSMLPVNF